MSTPGVKKSWDHCPICGNLDLRLHCQLPQPMFICANCRHIFFEQIPELHELNEYYHRYATDHNQVTLQQTALEYYKTHYQELIGQIDRERNRVTIMDYGCSYPVFLHVAKNEVGRVIGVDYDINVIKVGQEWGIEMYLPDSLSREVQDESIDIIRFAHSIEHLVDPLETLINVVPKLGPNGIIYITQPSFPIFTLTKLEEPIQDAVWPGHLHFFNAISLGILLRRAGLECYKLFTHQNAEAVMLKYLHNIDFAHAAKLGINLEESGCSFFGPLNNYPIWAGENCAAYARKSFTGSIHR